MKIVVLSLFVGLMATQSYTQQTTSVTAKQEGKSLVVGGKSYKTIMIGQQEWMAENLNLDVDSGCYCYDNSSSNCSKYGKLYTWEAAKRAAAIIPGWHLPSDAEWQQLERHLGMSNSDAGLTGLRGNIGNKLKSTSGWANGGNGNNSSGFNILPSGYLNSNGSFKSSGEYTIFWTSTPSGSKQAWGRSLHYTKSEVNRKEYNINPSYSVRLVRD